MKDIIYNTTTGNIYTIANEVQNTQSMLSNWPDASYIQVDELPIDYASVPYKVQLDTLQLQAMNGFVSATNNLM
jgi:hypothetical protein